MEVAAGVVEKVGIDICRTRSRRKRCCNFATAREYATPQISDRAVPFRSRLREIIRGRSEELEALAVEMYARGLSTRDIEALLPTSAANRC